MNNYMSISGKECSDKDINLPFISIRWKDGTEDRFHFSNFDESTLWHMAECIVYRWNLVSPGDYSCNMSSSMNWPEEEADVPFDVLEKLENYISAEIQHHLNPEPMTLPGGKTLYENVNMVSYMLSMNGVLDTDKDTFTYKRETWREMKDILDFIGEELRKKDM